MKLQSKNIAVNSVMFRGEEWNEKKAARWQQPENWVEMREYENCVNGNQTFS